MSKYSKKIIKKYKSSKKSSLIVYLILRLLVIICAFSQFLIGNIPNTILCIFSLVLFTLPTFFEEKLKIELPTLLESIVYVFIFSAEILGEINNFYGIIPYWDTILHTLNGFICAGVGLSLVDLLNVNSKNINLSPMYVAIVSFCFSMTVGVCWEFFEFSADYFLKTDMQKDRIVTTISSVELNEDKENKPIIINNIDSTEIKTKDGNTLIIENGYLDIGIIDTMKDLLVNLIGAVTFSIFGYIYIKNRDKNNLVEKFILKKIE